MYDIFQDLYQNWILIHTDVIKIQIIRAKYEMKIKKLHFFKLTLYNAKEIKYNGHITNKVSKTMKEVTYYEND